MHKISLIAIDLDGTLLSSDKQLSYENRQSLISAAEMGIEIVFATGRFFDGMPQIIRELPFIHYVISVNGAQVYDVRQKKTVCACEIPLNRALSVMERLDKLPVIYDCFQNGWGWMTQKQYDQAQQYAANVHSLEMIRNLRTPVPELKEYLKERSSDVQKIQAFFKDMEIRREMLKSLPEEFPDLVVTSAIVNNIEFNSKEATKGNAMRNLASYLGIPMEQTMSFGDDLNDISMIQAAGTGVAMRNANDEVRKVADFITDDCNNSGVAKAINRFILEK